MSTLYIVGLGPGNEQMMTLECIEAIKAAEVIVGYPVYLQLIEGLMADKEVLSTPMKQERQRCQLAIDRCKVGKKVAMVCSGDSGIYGMASLLYEMTENEPDVELIPVAGITAAISGAACLGSPLGHDFCVISLSDLLTPWETIERRLRACVMGDLCIALYNPASHRRKDYTGRACRILMDEGMEKTRACGYVRNIGRKGQEIHICSLSELIDADIDMFSSVFIGNSSTRIINDRLVTPRGYRP